MVERYIKAHSLAEALDTLLIEDQSKAIIAGGTDLLLDIRQGRHTSPDIFLDVSEIDEMRHIIVDGEKVFLGGAATHNEIVHSELLKEHAQCVVEGCGLIGGPQVRNVATIGGNVAHALPAGDGTISLLALDADVQIASSSGGTRWEPLIDIFEGPGKVTFDRKSELLVGFRFSRKKDRESSAFHRVMRPQGVAIAILNMAAWVKLDANDSIQDVRIACGPAGPRPFRAYQTESIFKGKIFDDNTFNQACRVLESEVSLRTSPHRATKKYREMLLSVLLREVLDAAVARCNYQ
ncbi:MAG TPA: FAD binding domain-containing protein [Anaerolineales bacterium]|nr:FAD binding domain-containing protein [Anaerolineales bacterium]